MIWAAILTWPWCWVSEFVLLEGCVDVLTGPVGEGAGAVDCPCDDHAVPGDVEVFGDDGRGCNWQGLALDPSSVASSPSAIAPRRVDLPLPETPVMHVCRWSGMATVASMTL